MSCPKRSLAGIVLVLMLPSSARAQAGEEPLTAAALSAHVSLVGGDTLAVVDGDEIRAADVFPVLFLTHTDLIYAALEQAVRRNLMLKEVDRLGVAVHPGVLAENVAEVLKNQDDEFKLSAGPDYEFEKFIQERYGTSPADYREAVRNQVLEELFLARVIRYEARLEEQVQVRMIILNDLDLAKEVASKLGEGANFAALAKTHSIDRTAAEGGRFPPVRRDCPHALLDGLPDLSVGQVTEVSTLERSGRRLYRILRLDRVIPADPRPYGEQAAEIEQGLEERKIDPFEVLEWDRRVRDRYPIEVRLGRA